MIIAFEYNPSQVKGDNGGIHTGNYIKDGKFHTQPNSCGWSTICYGPSGDIDMLAEIIEQLNAHIIEVYGEVPTASLVRKTVQIIVGALPNIKMLPEV